MADEKYATNPAFYLMKSSNPKPIGAQPGNQNAAIPPEEVLTERTYVYSTKPERVKWVKEAQRVPKRTLSEWLRGLANRETTGKDGVK